MKNNQRDFSGVFSLLLTPFDERREIDYGVYEQYVAWQLSHRPHGLFAVCGSSEMKWLEPDERLELARRAVRLAGDTPVVATANLDGDVTNHFDEMDRMIETGVTGVVLVPPSGMAADESRFEEYLLSLMDHSTVPVFLYEWPQVSPYLVSPRVLTRLSKHGLAGIKDTTCTMEGIKAKIAGSSVDTIVYQANAPYMQAAIAAGARGIMAVTTAAAADLVIQLWDAAMSGLATADDLQREVVSLDAVLRFGYPSLAKRLAQLRGVPMSLHGRWTINVTAEALQAIEIWYRGCRYLSAP